MSLYRYIELLLQQQRQQVIPLQDEKELIISDIEQEIECTRSYDVMTLSSDFDRLGYQLNSHHKRTRSYREHKLQRTLVFKLMLQYQQ